MIASRVVASLRGFAGARSDMLQGVVRKCAFFAGLVAIVGLLWSDGLGPEPASAAPVPITQAVQVRNFNFSPATFTAQVGQQVTVNLTNGGPSPHTFTITGLTDTGQIPSGGTKTVQLTPSQAGTLTFFCTIHGANVMSGQITVQMAAGSPSTSPVTNAAPQTQAPAPPSAPRTSQTVLQTTRPPSTGDGGLLSSIQ